MSDCVRFEEEGLLALEAGGELDRHFDECPDCRAARAEYRRLGKAIAVASADEGPAKDWRERVWSEIRRPEPPSAWWRGWWSGRWRGWALVPVGLAAVVAAAVLLTPHPASAPELVARVEPGDGPVRRGTEAQPGDRLVLEAVTGGLANAELRVYFNERELVLHCSTEAPCERRGEKLRGELALAAIGTYQPVFLAAKDPLPEPGRGLDADTAAAMRSGAVAELPKAIEVR